MNYEIYYTLDFKRSDGCFGFTLLSIYFYFLQLSLPVRVANIFMHMKL